MDQLSEFSLNIQTMRYSAISSADERRTSTWIHDIEELTELVQGRWYSEESGTGTFNLSTNQSVAEIHAM